MSKRSPRLKGEHLDRVCGKRTKEQPETLCGKVATIHIVWTVNARGEITGMGYACEEHREEATEEVESVQWHRVGACCGMPGSRWFFEENVCRYADGLPVAEVERQELVRAS